MAYAEPSVTTFKARFPEFFNVSNELIELVLSECVASVGSNFLERDRAAAQLYLAAHKLTMEGEPARSNSIANGSTAVSAAAGPIIEMRDRDVSVKFAENADTTGGQGALTNAYNRTQYGREYLLLVSRNVASVITP